MKHKNNFRLILMALLTFSIFSCKDESYDFDDIVTESVQQYGEFAVLGKKNEIPFTVENMQVAYKSLLENKTASLYPDDVQYLKNNNARSIGNYQITTTHYYIKFNPRDSIQYEEIANDTILAVSDTPFEYNIDTEGAKYQARELIGTDFTYYYSVVPVNYSLPKGVPYERLANLHFTNEDLIPDDAPELELQKVDFYHDLNLETLKLTNNLEEEKEELLYTFTNANGVEEKLTWQESQNKGLNLQQLVINFKEDDYEEKGFFSRRRRWSPSGTITVQEDAINRSVGVMGARIKVRKWGWLVIRRATTSRSGYFRASSTRTKRVKYASYFKHQPNFTVKAGTWFWNAKDRGTRTHKRSSWRRHYTYGRRQFYAFVQNAAYDYYSRVASAYSITTPRNRINISAEYNLCGSSQHRIGILQLLPISRIRVTRKQSNCSYRGSDGIYATTVHELTHAGHNRLDPGMFSLFHQRSCERAFLTESWAEGVETIVTNDRYRSLDVNYRATNRYNNTNLKYWNDSRQTSIVANMTEYTPIVADLVDNVNQSTLPSISGSQPIDRVRGYNLDKIERALDNCRTITCWESSLRTKFYNSTEGNLKELFNYVRAARYNNNPKRCD